MHNMEKLISSLFENDKKIRNIFYIFFICVLLLDVWSVVSSYKQRQKKYNDFYSSEKIFYIQVKRYVKGEEVIESNEYIKIGAYLYYEQGKSDYFEMDRLVYSTGYVSQLYYIVCDKKYQSASFKIVDAYSNATIINETYPTEIHMFGTYELFFESGWPYNYARSSWTTPQITSTEFNDLFIKQHDGTSKDNYMIGIYSYPNLSNSFSSILSNVNELKSIAGQNPSLSGNNAYEQWLSIKEEFLKEGTKNV